MKENDELWKQFIKMTLELFGFPFKEIYTSKGFNRLYSDYKCFTQHKSYQQFAYWIFGFFILNIFHQMQSDDAIAIIKGMYTCPIIILVILVSKIFILKYFEKQSKFYLENILVLTVSVIFPKPNLLEYGVFFEFLIYQSNLESLPFKLAYVFLSQLILKPSLIYINVITFFILLMLAIYQELLRYTSYIQDYEIVQKNKTQQKQLLEFIISTQNDQEKDKMNRKLNKQLFEARKQENQKFSFSKLIEYIF